MWFISDHVKGTGHVGIVVAGDGEQVLCIEGNSENQIRYVRRMRSEVYFSRTRDEEMPLPPITFKAAPLVHVKKDGTR